MKAEQLHVEDQVSGTATESARGPLTPISHEIPLIPGARRFHGRSAIVTGASRGIGRAVASRLRANGASVAIVARGHADLLKTGSAIKVDPICADMAAAETPMRLVSHAEAAWGRLDMLILAGGSVSFGNLEDASVEDFDELFSVNVRATFLLLKAALPMLRRSRGQIVFVNTTAIRANHLAGRGLYVASKLALKGIADALRDEVNEDGVRVITVLPGSSATEGGRMAHGVQGKPWQPERLIQPDDVAILIAEALALPRTAEVTDLYVRPFRKS